MLLVALLLAMVAPLAGASTAAAPSVSPYIVGGDLAATGAWPGVAAVSIVGPHGSFFCGGTVVDPRWVMTAAHCGLEASPLLTHVLVGTNRLDSGGVLRTVDQVRIHPLYGGLSGTSFEDDVALLHLSSDAGVEPVHLLPAALAAYAAGGVQGTAVGWGYTQGGGSVQTAQRQVAIPLVSNAACQASYNAAHFAVTITPDMLCAGSPPNQGTCSGDSGGPLFVTQANVRYQAGIVSWGASGCQVAGAYSVFSRVSAHQSWIETVLGHPLDVPSRLELRLAPDWVDAYSLDIRNANGSMSLATCQGHRLAGDLACLAQVGAPLTVNATGPGKLTLSAGLYQLRVRAFDSDGLPISANMTRQATLRAGALSVQSFTLRLTAVLGRAAIAQTYVPRAAVRALDAIGTELGACDLDGVAATLTCSGLATAAYPYFVWPTAGRKVTVQGLAVDGANATKVATVAVPVGQARIVRVAPALSLTGAVILPTLVNRPTFNYTLNVTAWGGAALGSCDVDPLPAPTALACTGGLHALKGLAVLVGSAGKFNLTVDAAGHTPPASRVLSLRAAAVTGVSNRFT